MGELSLGIMGELALGIMGELALGIMRAGPAPHLCSTEELTLVEETWVS